MYGSIDIQILFYDCLGEKVLASVLNPRKFTMKSGFGAMPRRCWLELYQEDRNTPADVGSYLEIRIRGIRCFWGRIQQRRIDSIDDPLSFYADFDPHREFNRQVFGTFENRTSTEILQDILEESPLVRHDSLESTLRFRKIIFSGESLFAAIDLLSKLAGNWWWDVREDGVLFFRPPTGLPVHEVVLRRDTDVFNLWKTTTDRYSQVEIEGGGSDMQNYRWILDTLGQHNAPENACIRVYLRSIATPDAAAALRQAVVQQMETPHYEHFVDWTGNGETVKPGESVCFKPEYRSLFPETQRFRIKTREITYAHETLQTRFHVTSGNESSETYFHYFRVDHPIPRFGAFQMDVSALDSIAYLDAAI